MSLPPPYPDSWPTDPRELTPPPTPWPYTLDQLTDEQLSNGQLALTIMCGRSKTPLKKKQRAIICVLSTILLFEKQRRAAP